MGAAALTGRLRLTRAARVATTAVGDSILAFQSAGGPVVALCGLVGGAGTTTLAYLLARRAARQSRAPVLLAELREQGGLAALAGHASPLGLRELALAAAEERQVDRPFVELESGLRLVACARPGCGTVAPSALPELVAHAREAHGLVVLDTGQLTNASETDVLLQSADHVLFVLPATVAALRRAELLARAAAFSAAAGHRATLVAIATRPGRSAAHKQLRRLAESHTDRLLLVPHIPELQAGQHENIQGDLEGSFAALATILRRQP